MTWWKPAVSLLCPLSGHICGTRTSLDRMLNLATWIYSQSLIHHRYGRICSSSKIPVVQQICIGKVLSLHYHHPPCLSAHLFTFARKDSNHWRRRPPGFCKTTPLLLAQWRKHNQYTKYLVASVPHKPWLDIRMQNQPKWGHVRAKGRWAPNSEMV